ncbi:MAG: metallophosphoesterase family protein [Alphaproteobacteria bacterium]|nr:metallophosphoesterase family protein [Alphaproteobacteria bacterium]MCB9794955.1 metallophosphoesterase family protein [Alphaproteobacteria bacterium]
MLLLHLLACTTPPSATDSPWGPEADCGVPLAPGAVEGLLRWPYPQNVTVDGATLMWGGPAGSSQARLWLGPSADALEPVDAEAQLIAISDEEPPQMMQLWRARAEGLQPGTEYCYGVEVDGVVLTRGLKLRTAPDDLRAPLRFMVLGDFGAGTLDQLLVREQMLQHADGVDLLLTTGDNAYSSGTWGEWQANVFEVYQELTTRMQWLPTPGNHDYSTDEAEPYFAQFELPTDAWREADKERYYTYHYGALTWLALNTETPAVEIRASEDDDELDWLQATLPTLDRPWVVAGFHKPAVSGHATRAPDPFALGLFVPALEAAGVPLVLQGHNHFYERFHPLLEGELTPRGEGGVTFITTGGGGRGLYDMKDDSRRAVGIAEHHFLLGEVDDCRLKLTAIAKDGRVLDELSLYRTCR